jgi:sugar phosphate isomerase/epimerase
MSTLKLSVTIDCRAGEPAARLIQAAAALSVDGVEISASGAFAPEDFGVTARRDLARRLANARLQCAAVLVDFKRGLTNAGDGEGNLERLAAAGELARSLGAALVAGTLGALPGGEKPPPETLQALREAGDRVDRIGLRLGLRTDAAPDALAPYFAAAPGILGVVMDPSAALAAGRSPADDAMGFSGRIFHVLATDAGRDSFAAPGRGDARWPELLGVLESVGYNGYIGLRALPGVRLEEARDSIRASGA